MLGEERERADETGGIGTCLSRGTGDSRAACSRGAQVHRSAFVVAHNTLKKAGIFLFFYFFSATWVEPRSHFHCSHMKPLLPVWSPQSPGGGGSLIFFFLNPGAKRLGFFFLRRLGEQFDDGAVESEHFSPCGVLN